MDRLLADVPVKRSRTAGAGSSKGNNIGHDNDMDMPRCHGDGIGAETTVDGMALLANATSEPQPLTEPPSKVNDEIQYNMRVCNRKA